MTHRSIVFWLVAFVAVAIVFNCLSVYANVGTQAPVALAIHGGTAAGMLMLAGALFRRHTVSA